MSKADARCGTEKVPLRSRKELLRRSPAGLASYLRTHWSESALGLILLVTFAIRLAYIGHPSLPTTAWKEIDYVEISRNFRAHGFNIFTPQETWPATPPRVTAMEFPLVPWLAGLLYAVAGFSVVTVRLLPVLAWLLLAMYVFLLGRRWSRPSTGVIAAAFAAAMPLWHPFGRYLFSDPFAVMAGAAAVWYSQRWVDLRSRRQLALAASFFGLAVLLKVESLWIGLPMAVIVLPPLWRSRRDLIATVLAAALALLPAVGWYAWAYYLELHALPAFSVFRGHDKFQTVAQLSTLEWWSVMGHRLIAECGGLLGFAVLLVGLAVVLSRRRQWTALIAWAAAVVAYTFLVAQGQVDAPYRQLYAIPVLALFMGVGLESVGLRLHAFGRRLLSLGRADSLETGKPRLVVVHGALVVAILGVLLGLNASAITGPRTDADPIRWAAATQLRAMSSPGQTVVVAGEYDPQVGGNDISPVLYYYADMRGWTLQPGQCTVTRVEQLAAEGASFFVEVPPFGSRSLDTCTPQTRADLQNRYPTIHSGDYLLLRLEPTGSQP